MYDSFYGLTARPFQLTPDPRFWFESATHRTAMSYLGYGLAQGEGFIVITGEVGSGKTILVGHVCHAIDAQRLTAIKLVSTQVADADLLRLIANEMSIAVEGPGKSHALTAIENFLHEEARAGRRVLLIVDEAQNLAVSALEELRMLSNFQLGETPLLQIFLLAQPEFRQTVASPELEQLRQRIIATHHLEPMLPEELEPYIAHRMSLVGWQQDPSFTADFYDELWRASAGIPRRVNGIINRVLLHGAVEESHRLTGEDVRNVVNDMGLSPEELAEAPSSPIAHMAEAADPAPAEPALEEFVAVEPVVEEAPVVDPEPVAEAEPVAEVLVEREIEAETLAEPGFSAAAYQAPTPEADDYASVDVESTASVIVMPQAGRPISPAGDAGHLAAINALKDRVHTLEERCDEQDAAIRRVLGLLIQWVEQDENAPQFASSGRAA
ncbi:MAG: XrtA/PEP-CTERM system-associated ATPase [Sphingopyxis sp.]